MICGVRISENRGFSRGTRVSRIELVTSEDIEWLMRVEKSGGRILYEPRAVVRHCISANRTTKRYLRRRIMALDSASMAWKTRRNDFETWGFREIGLAIVRLNFKRVGLWLKILVAQLPVSVDRFDRELDSWRALGGIQARLTDAWRQLGEKLWRISR